MGDLYQIPEAGDVAGTCKGDFPSSLRVQRLWLVCVKQQARPPQPREHAVFRRVYADSFRCPRKARGWVKLGVPLPIRTESASGLQDEQSLAHRTK